MRIKRLELKNFRGFEELTINFPEAPNNVAVFVGVNGAGKTSVLEAINNLLYKFCLDLTRENREKDNILSDPPPWLKDSDVRYNTEKCEIFISFEFKGEKAWVENNVHASGGSYRMRSGAYIDMEEAMIKNIRSILYNTLWLTAPVISFYPTDRLLQNPNIEIIDLNKIKPWNVYDEAFNITINFQDFFRWFRSMEDVENEKRLSENNNYRDIALQTFREILPSFLSNYSNPRIQRQPDEDLILKKGEQVLSIKSLSHGEKLLFTLVGDLIRRASITFPHAPLKAEGVVLIDEIELHLHPGWQRKIVPLLTKTFPNIQFIITTHSPVVLSTVKRENIFILEDFKLVEKTPHTYGRDINSILYQTFGVEERQPEVENEFRKLYALIDDPERVEEAKATLEKMKEKYGADDPELIRADMHLEFLTN